MCGPEFFKTSIGKKYLMAITGLIWSGFVMGHMLGNTLIFLGPEAYNRYAHAIVSNLPLLYMTEIVLSLTLLVHIVMAVQLTLQNRAAQGVASSMIPHGDRGASLASRTMIYHGSLILVFVVYHLISFKYGPYYEVQYDGEKMRDVFRLVQESFQNPGFVAWYVVCLLGLGFHLSHGFASSFQSLGLFSLDFHKKMKKIGCIYSVVVAFGFIAQPIYFYFFY